MSVLNRILKTKQEEVTERKNRISERGADEYAFSWETTVIDAKGLGGIGNRDHCRENLNGSLLPEDLFMRQPECRRWWADVYGMVLRLVRC